MQTKLSCIANISNITTQITGDMPVEFWEELSFRMSYEIPGAQFSQHYQSKRWDGRKKLFNKRWLSFPTGLFSHFRDAARDFGIEYTVNDLRQIPNRGPVIPLKGITLRDYQDHAVSLALKKQRGMIHAATGAGKTEMIADIVGKLNVPTLILIHKQDIFHQLVARLGSRLGTYIGEIGCGKVYPQHITVGMIQTVHKAYGGNLRGMKNIDKDDTVIPKPEIIKQFVERVECVIIDEAHHVAASIFGIVLPHCEKAYYRYGFSASPFREDNADLLLDAHTGQKCVSITASDLIAQGHLAKPTIHLLNFDHKRPNAFGYPDMYQQQVVNNTFRNKLVVQSCLRAMAANKSVLVAVTRIEHGRMLEAMLKQCVPGKVAFASGQKSAEERRKILDDLDKKKINIAIATTVFGEGIDCPSLDVLVNAKANKSAIDSLQLVGRVLRKTPNKDKATVIDIYDDHCKYLGKHAKERLRLYKTEPEFTVKRIKNPNEIIFT